MKMLLKRFALALSITSATSFLNPSFSNTICRQCVITTSSTTASTLYNIRHNINHPQKASFVTVQMSAAEFAKNEIDNNKVVIFSKTYCPYCSRTKQLFSELNVDGTVIHELDTMDNGDAIQAALAEMTGQRTVPNVFIKGKHVGGNDACQAANASGKLKELLEA